MSETKPQSSKPSRKVPRVGAPANGVAECFDVLTLEEAAAYLRVGAENVLHMAVTENLPGRKIGTEWRFLKSALREWLSPCPRNSGLLGQLGKIKDDPYIEDMLADIYARRGRPSTAER